MNTDYLVQDKIIREQRLDDRLRCRQCKHRSCDKVGTYAKEQNTVYDPVDNLMLYGINTNMGVLGVSDGTCNQINPQIFTPNQICGFGAAGGNPCRPDAYGIEPFQCDETNCDYCGSIQIAIVIVLLAIFALFFFLKKNRSVKDL